MTVAFVSLLFMTTNWAANVFFAKDDLGLGNVGYGLLLSVGRRAWCSARRCCPSSGLGHARGRRARRDRDSGPRARGSRVVARPRAAFSFFFVGGWPRHEERAHSHTDPRTRAELAPRQGVRRLQRAPKRGRARRARRWRAARERDGRTTMALAGAIPLVAALAGLALYRARATQSPPVAEAAQPAASAERSPRYAHHRKTAPSASAAPNAARPPSAPPRRNRGPPRPRASRG